jgi:hypothetical protein
MEKVNRPDDLETSPQLFESGHYQRNSFLDSVLTDTALSQLKEQSSNGCVLCSLDALDGEEWE